MAMYVDQQDGLICLGNIPALFSSQLSTNVLAMYSAGTSRTLAN